MNLLNNVTRHISNILKIDSQSYNINRMVAINTDFIIHYVPVKEQNYLLSRMKKKSGRYFNTNT